MSVAMARAEQANSAARALPTICRVEAHVEGDAGLALRATGAASAGDVLLEVPLAACLTSRDLDGHPFSERLRPDDSFGRLLVALLLLMEGRLGSGLQGEADPRAEYYTKVVPADNFEVSMMSCWKAPELEPRLANSCSWKRGQAFRQQVEEEWEALAKEGLVMPFERALWAQSVLKTRAIDAGGAVGHFLAPVLDLANHRSLGSNVKLKVSEGCARFVALEEVDVGEEVTWCYDPAADYLDLFERYGFFDEQNPVRTAEVSVPRDALLGADVAEWRRNLVEAQAERGCNLDLHAWWIPEVRAEASPLFAAVRALFIAQEELQDGSEAECRGADAGSDVDLRLKRPIRAEADVRRRVVELVEAHLAGYSTSVLEDAVDLEQLPGRSVAARPEEEMALRLLVFEKSLLHRLLEELRGTGMAGSS